MQSSGTGRPPLLDQWDRFRLRRAALRYADNGWAVTPGAWLAGRRFYCGRPGCLIMSCHPATDSWQHEATTDRTRVAQWWRQQPYAVLLVTGYAFDALEVPAAVGRRVLAAAGQNRATLGPIAVTAAGNWMLLIQPGTPVRVELEQRLDIVRHGRGSWIPAAPSPMADGPVLWAVRPEQTRWELPASEAMQGLVIEALNGTRHKSSKAGASNNTDPAESVHTRRLVVPRQLSTARRAA